MKYSNSRKALFFILILLSLFALTSCGVLEDIICDQECDCNENHLDNNVDGNEEANINNNEEPVSPPQDEPTEPPPPEETEPPPKEPKMTKWDLWNSDETMLRGANIWSALVVPALDWGFKGDGYIGPPFTQEDFDNLAALGANYVTISGPGLFTEKPPYEVDLEVVAEVDGLVEMIGSADMFVTIAFRTGPGRSEYSLCCEGEDWANGYFNDKMWTIQEAQDAWVDMWGWTAEHYRDNPYVVGYKLMVEPNVAGILFDIWEPDVFYNRYADTLYDWNQLYPRIVEGIRKVDSDTPILVNAEGFSAIEWLPYLKPVDAEKIVYIAHQYEPYNQYTAQEAWVKHEYPGRFDLDWDGASDDFNLEFLENLLSTLDDYSTEHSVPVGVDEFGVVRYAPGAAVYIDDIMGLFEERGINYSLWEWSTTFRIFEEDIHEFNFRFGPEFNNRKDSPSDLLDVIIKYWSLNTIRPSNAPWVIGE